MEKLLFNEPLHKKGKNLTVRKGIKWSLERWADVQGLGVVPITTKVMRFKDITGADICVLQHDPDCRNLLGLHRALIKAYPDFDKREMVTLVYYDARDVTGPLIKRPTDLTIGTMVDKSKATESIQGPLKSTPYYKSK